MHNLIHWTLVKQGMRLFCNLPLLPELTILLITHQGGKECLPHTQAKGCMWDGKEATLQQEKMDIVSHPPPLVHWETGSSTDIVASSIHFHPHKLLDEIQKGLGLFPRSRE